MTDVHMSHDPGAPESTSPRAARSREKMLRAATDLIGVAGVFNADFSTDGSLVILNNSSIGDEGKLLGNDLSFDGFQAHLQRPVRP